VGARLIIFVDRRAELGGEIDGIEDVLHAHRQAAQRERRKARGLRLAPGAGDVERRQRAHLLLARSDRLGAGIDHVGRAELAGFDAAREIESLKHHAVLSMRPTMRSVTARANGNAMNAVTAATGQPTTKAESQRGTKSARRPMLKKVTTALTMNTMIAVITIGK